jgi:hypothetical protein
VGYTTGRDLRPAPKVGYATTAIIPFSVRAVKSYTPLLKLRSPLKRGFAGVHKEKTFERGRRRILQGGKVCPAIIPGYPLIRSVFRESSCFENGRIGDRANRDALW